MRVAGARQADRNGGLQKSPCKSMFGGASKKFNPPNHNLLQR
jgi:hypothetical protein